MRNRERHMYLSYRSHQKSVELECRSEEWSDNISQICHRDIRIILLETPVTKEQRYHNRVQLLVNVFKERETLTRLNSGAIHFRSWATTPSISLTLFLSFLNKISSPASPSASTRPLSAIHSAHAQSAPATSSIWTVCEGCLPGDHLERDYRMH